MEGKAKNVFQIKTKSSTFCYLSPPSNILLWIEGYKHSMQAQADPEYQYSFPTDIH
jgi:hypothetical protein